MFSFLNRTKNQSNDVVGSQSLSSPIDDQLKSQEINASTLELHLNQIRKNLLEAIILKRTDIVLSLITEWFKGIFVIMFYIRIIIYYEILKYLINF